MKWLDTLGRKMGRRYIRDLMKYLVLAMAGVFILEYLPLEKSAWDLLCFDREAIFRGEVWRAVTFLFLPPSGHIAWIVISLYFYYFLGTGLETHWGGAQFNLYYMAGALCAMAGGFITGYATNEYLNLSLLMAFAVIYPEVPFNLFFYIPVKVKWIGLATGAYLVYQIIVVSWPGRLAIGLALIPLLLFCGDKLWFRMVLIFRRVRRRLNMH
ncbi:MAG: hypothetical protein E7324_02980 [Clostridiales bacterium]|nr:hypothetical protein [Clostridiales bacterium]